MPSDPPIQGPPEPTWRGEFGPVITENGRTFQYLQVAPPPNPYVPFVDLKIFRLKKDAEGNMVHDSEYPIIDLSPIPPAYLKEFRYNDQTGIGADDCTIVLFDPGWDLIDNILAGTFPGTDRQVTQDDQDMGFVFYNNDLQVRWGYATNDPTQFGTDIDKSSLASRVRSLTIVDYSVVFMGYGTEVTIKATDRAAVENSVRAKKVTYPTVEMRKKGQVRISDIVIEIAKQNKWHYTQDYVQGDKDAHGHDTYVTKDPSIVQTKVLQHELYDNGETDDLPDIARYCRRFIQSGVDDLEFINTELTKLAASEPKDQFKSQAGYRFYLRTKPPESVANYGGGVIFGKRIPAAVGVWEDKIKAAAAAEGIDANLLTGLVSQESSGDPAAIGRDTQGRPAGRGLAGVTLTTARMLQPGITVEQLHDPDTNLRLGARYLKQQIAVDGNVENGLLRYRHGPTAFANGNIQSEPDYGKKVLRYAAAAASAFETADSEPQVQGPPLIESVAYFQPTRYSRGMEIPGNPNEIIPIFLYKRGPDNVVLTWAPKVPGRAMVVLGAGAQAASSMDPDAKTGSKVVKSAHPKDEDPDMPNVVFGDRTFEIIRTLAEVDNRVASREESHTDMSATDSSIRAASRQKWMRDYLFTGSIEMLGDPRVEGGHNVFILAVNQHGRPHYTSGEYFGIQVQHGILSGAYTMAMEVQRTSSPLLGYFQTHGVDARAQETPDAVAADNDG